jgi:hypothetical protein
LTAADGNGPKFSAEVLELLGRAQELIAPTAYRQPDLFFQAWRLLTNGKELPYGETIINLWEPSRQEHKDALEAYPSLPVGVHGHARGRPCYAIDMCHFSGYTPTGAEHPVFIRNFKKRWGYLYD